LVFKVSEGLAAGGAVEFSLAAEKDVACVAGDGDVRAQLVDKKCQQFLVGWHVLWVDCCVRKDSDLVAESGNKVDIRFFVVH
jgi:hypothetical protein